MKYNMSSGCFVSISLSMALLVLLCYPWSNIILPFAAIHPSLMCSSCVLQHKPVPLYRAVFSSIVPGHRSHENRVHPYTRMGAI